MAPPRVALRFRDTTPDIDTIAEHQRLIEQHGSCWWGWWRKDWEPEFASLFQELATVRGSVVLVDRSTRSAFHAEFLQATRDGAQVDDERIPPYYQAFKQSVSGWFLLTSINTVQYDAKIGMRLGATTLLILDAAELPAPTRPSPHKSGRHCLLHLSDLHFGKDYAYLPPGKTPEIGDTRQTLTHCIVKDLARLELQDDIGLVIISGDFTTGGDWTDVTRNSILKEVENLLAALKLSKDALLAIPGNHDVVRYPEGANIDVAMLAVDRQTRKEHETTFRVFQEELTGRRWNEPLTYSSRFTLDNVEIDVRALNSCNIVPTKWTEYGYVGIDGLDVLSENHGSSSGLPVLKILAIHHHLLPTIGVEAPNKQGVSLTLDAVELLDSAQMNGVDLILHGHQHRARISQYASLPFMNGDVRQPMIIVSGGSAGAKADRLPGSDRNTYSVFEIQPSEIHLWLRELRFDAQEGAMLFDGPLPIHPS